MKKKICILTIIIMALICCTTPVFANGTKTERCYGVVLNYEGDGMAIDMATKRPVDPYYNYTSYSKVNAEPGQIVYTIAITDEDGEWLSRKDYPLNIWVEDSELNKLIEIYTLNQRVSDLAW